VTEDQAKTTRCCGPNGCGEVRDDMRGLPDNAPRYCIGSACMAWRWELTDRGHRVFQTKGLEVLIQEAAPNKLTGYCGLAGKP